MTLPNDFIYSDNYRYINSTDSRGSTIVSNLTSSSTSLTKEEQKSLEGILYVKNGNYSTSEPLSSALANIITKYSTAVQNQLSQDLIDFDIIQNTIFLETKSSLVIDKISYKDGKFNVPSTINTLYTVNSANMVEVFTNRFYVEDTNKVYFARFRDDLNDTCGPIADNYKAVYPEIYEYDIQQHTSTKIYPEGVTDVSLSAFELNIPSLSARNYTPDSVHTPTIVYNSLNDLFKLTYIIYDKNDFSHIVDVSFKMTDNKLTVVDSNRYESLNNIARTSTFGDTTNFNSISASHGSFTRDSSSALTLDINWGDSSNIQYAQKDIVFNYKTNSIFDEVLYGKVGGTILNQYEHTYAPVVSSFFTNLTAQFLIHYNNGFYANINQPIKLIRESYYDNIQKVGITSTQMVGISASNTIANLQSKFNNATYITFLNN